jgi:CRP-like cAMP-binding protein
MTPELQKIARNSVLMRGMPPPVADALLSTARLRQCDRNATIFLQGETADAIFIVADGWVKLYRITPHGSEAVVAVFTKGASFGEAVALQGGAYPVACEAVTEATLIRIDAETFRNILKQSPEAALSMLSATYMHLHSLVAQVEELKARTGAQRVASFLLELAPCGQGSCEVTLPYDKALIAGRLGLQPESLSRAFAKLKSHGVTIKVNQASIEDVEALRLLAEEDRAHSWSKD